MKNITEKAKLGEEIKRAMDLLFEDGHECEHVATIDTSKYSLSKEKIKQIVSNINTNGLANYKRSVFEYSFDFVPWENKIWIVKRKDPKNTTNVTHADKNYDEVLQIFRVLNCISHIVSNMEYTDNAKKRGLYISSYYYDLVEFSKLINSLNNTSIHPYTKYSFAWDDRFCKIIITKKTTIREDEKLSNHLDELHKKITTECDILKDTANTIGIPLTTTDTILLAEDMYNKKENKENMDVLKSSTGPKNIPVRGDITECKPDATHRAFNEELAKMLTRAKDSIAYTHECYHLIITNKYDIKTVMNEINLFNAVYDKKYRCEIETVAENGYKIIVRDEHKTYEKIKELIYRGITILDLNNINQKSITVHLDPSIDNIDDIYDVLDKLKSDSLYNAFQYDIHHEKNPDWKNYYVIIIKKAH